MAWRCLHWRLRTGSRAVGTEPYRITTCHVVWAAGLERTGTRIFIVLQGAGCSVEDAGEGPSYSVMLCDRLSPARMPGCTALLCVRPSQLVCAIGSRRRRT